MVVTAPFEMGRADAGTSGDRVTPRSVTASAVLSQTRKLRCLGWQARDRRKYMGTNRLEAISDGVFAIIVTIMVLELKVPEGHELSDLVHTTGVGLLTYLLSFVYVGIYWNNHHHMFHLVRTVSGGVLWANLMLLFCLSLLPFTTAWLNESKVDRIPVVVYGLNLLAASIAYVVLQTVIIRGQGRGSALRQAVGTDRKAKTSHGLLLAGILSALVLGPGGQVGTGLAVACFIGVAIIWIIPDRRVGRLVHQREGRG
jgi:uncharacterized membrane protein